MTVGQNPPKLSEELERWLNAEGDRTVGSLLDTFGERSFAVLFILLLSVPALPLPTGGATHVLEVITALLALQLIVGRKQIWLPERWRRLEIAGSRQQRFISGLMRLLRRLERFSRPRMTFLLHGRMSDIIFGLLITGAAAGAFFAPPFTGLDTLPALGGVLVSIGVVLGDALIAVLGVGVGTAGIVLEIVLGSAAVHVLGRIA